MNNEEFGKGNSENPENLLHELEVQRKLLETKRLSHPKRNGRLLTIGILIFLACAGCIALYVAVSMLEGAAQSSTKTGTSGTVEQTAH